MNELVIERAALPKQVSDWLETEIEEGKPSLLILRKDQGRYILQRAQEANPEVMKIARKVAVERAALLTRLADA